MNDINIQISTGIGTGKSIYKLMHWYHFMGLDETYDILMKPKYKKLNQAHLLFP